MAVSLRDIRLFVAVCEESSFTAAAQREGATQSGVSQHVSNLEISLGVKLLSRDKVPIEPTPAGEQFYQRCIEVLTAAATATQAVSRYRIGLAGSIVVGLMPTMTRQIVAPALHSFMSDNPNVDIRIVEGYSDVLMKMARAGDLDFAVIPSVSYAKGIKRELFLRTPEILVSRESSPWADMKPVQLSQLGPLRLIVPSRLNARRTTLDGYFADHGVEVSHRLELDSMLGTLHLIETTNWSAILPAILFDEKTDSSRFTMNRIAGPTLTLDLIVVEAARHVLSRAAESFLTVLRQTTITLNNRWSEPKDSDR